MGCLVICFFLVMTHHTLARFQSPPNRTLLYEEGVDHTANLSCVIQKPLTSQLVFWRIVDPVFVLYSEGSGVLNPDKYDVEVLERETSSDFRLVIKDLNINDTGRYACQYGVEGSVEVLVSFVDADQVLQTSAGDRPVTAGTPTVKTTQSKNTDFLPKTRNCGSILILGSPGGLLVAALTMVTAILAM